MTWARFDDRYHDNPKVTAAWTMEPAAVGLHAMAITYCAMHATDGLLPEGWVKQKMPVAGRRKKTVDALVCTGLFEPIGDGRFLIHDYLDFNPSSSDLQERRRKDSQRKRSGIHAESNGIPNGSVVESERIPDDASRTPAGAGAHSRGPARPGTAFRDQT